MLSTTAAPRSKVCFAMLRKCHPKWAKQCVSTACIGVFFGAALAGDRVRRQDRRGVQLVRVHHFGDFTDGMHQVLALARRQF